MIWLRSIPLYYQNDMIRYQVQDAPKSLGLPFQALLAVLVYWRTELSICVDFICVFCFLNERNVFVLKKIAQNLDGVKTTSGNKRGFKYYY